MPPRRTAHRSSSSPATSARSALAGHASYTLLASNRIQRIASDMLPSQLSAALVVEALYYLLVGNFDLN